MKPNHLKGALLAAAALVPALQGMAQIPAGYYDALRGKKGAELKTAIHNIIKHADVLEYGSGKASTWWGFYTTDNDNGYVVDRYSNEKRKFGKQGSSVSGMNIEHSFPKSWWGGTQTQAYKDLFNLMPSDADANSSKSNYGMGTVTNASFNNGCIKVGSGSQGFKVWQPSKQWQGDFSRGYMYMATAYQDYTWSGSAALSSLQQGAYPTLKKWAYELYIKWAKEDPVSADEVKRNNAVYRIQGNRNPYIDFPNLMEYVWGDSVDYAFDPSRTVTSEHYTGGSGGDTPLPGGEDIYTVNYKTDGGNCTVNTTAGPDGVWTRDVRFGWKGSGYINGSKNASDCYLLTPELDLTALADAQMQFAHAANYVSDPSQAFSVEVLADGQYTKLDGIAWPVSDGKWAFVESGDIDLTPFVGKKIRLAFHYTSTASVAGTWEIRDIAVTGTRTASAITAPGTAPAAFSPARPYEVFTLGGQRLNKGNKGHGTVIVRQDGHTWKMVR